MSEPTLESPEITETLDVWVAVLGVDEVPDERAVGQPRPQPAGELALGQHARYLPHDQTVTQ